MNKNLFGRRQFLGQASCAGLGSLTFLNSWLNLRAINAGAISNSSVIDNPNGYKAIVCILLAGGNDSYNMLVPYDNARYNHYVNARGGYYVDENGGLALSKSPTYTDPPDNTVINPGSNLQSGLLNYNSGGQQYAVHPSMQGVKNLFNTNKLSFISNIGTLIYPNLTKQQYWQGNNLPIGLFSHSDQIQEWQTGLPHERSAKGWGGKMADMIGDCNANQNISMNVSLSGSNIFQTGNTTVEYAIDQNGAAGFDEYDSPEWIFNKLRIDAFDSMLGQQYQDIFKKTYINTIEDARDAYQEFSDALEGSADFGNIFPQSYFGGNLEMIAKTISVRNTLGFSRQIFYITYGGWDHHDEVINNQNGMLGDISGGLAAFMQGLEQIGQQNNVLTMFISEFGRTITSNGNGSDHAWGGNTMVMGGPNLINGGQIFGNYPNLNISESFDNPLYIDYGAFIPTLSTDQYFAEVASWFGVNDPNDLFPNLQNFTQKSVGFLK